MENVMLKEVQEMAKKFETVEQVKKELKKVQSIKCRLAKQKEREDYDTEMTKVVKKEQLLKEVRSYLEPKKLTVTTMTFEQIQTLNYDDTVKAIKSIQSKKCLSQYNTKNLDENVEYQQALRIEEMLKEHRQNIKPLEDTVIRKSDIMNLIEHIEIQEEKISKAYILELLNDLM